MSSLRVIKGLSWQQLSTLYLLLDSHPLHPFEVEDEGDVWAIAQHGGVQVTHLKISLILIAEPNKIYSFDNGHINKYRVHSSCDSYSTIERCLLKYHKNSSG